MLGAKLSRWFTVILAVALWAALPIGTASAQDVAVPKENPGDEDIEQAKKHMKAGVAFTNDPEGSRYEEAYPEFRKAYQLSGSLNALLNLGICAMKLELDGEAISYYETFLEKKGEDIDANDKEHVERDLAALKSAVAWVTLSSDRPDTDLYDERTPRRGASVRNTYKIGVANKRFGIHPGTHVFTAKAEGFEDKKWSIEIKNGQTYSHDFVFDKNAPVTAEGFKSTDMNGNGNGNNNGNGSGSGSGSGADEGGSRPVPVYAWVVLGVTVASAATMGAMMGVAASKKSDYDNNILGQAPLDEQEAAQSDIQTFNLLSDVFIGVTAAGAVTTLILILTRPTVKEEGAEASAAGYGDTWTLAPAIDPRGGGAMSFTATF